MTKLIYEVFTREEGNPRRPPDNLIPQCKIYEDGYLTFAESMFASNKQMDGYAHIEYGRALMKDHGEKCEPWDYGIEEEPYINELYPAAFYTLCCGGYFCVVSQSTVREEPFFPITFHRDADGLLLDDDGNRGYREITVIKYHGGGEPWIPNPAWEPLPEGLVF